MEVCILTGGRSGRMGCEKPLIQLGGSTLIESLIHKVDDIADHIYLITNRDNASLYVRYVNDRISVIQDKIEDVGPMGGIHAGLSEIENDRAFFLASDMPLLDPGVLKGLETAYFADPEVGAVVCKTAERIEPLVAIYSKQILPVLTSQIEECRLSLRELLEKIDTSFFEYEDTRIFSNLNWPSDVERLTNGDL